MRGRSSSTRLRTAARRTPGSWAELRGPSGLDLVRVVLVAAVEVRRPHPPAPVLVLPDVAQLVGDQVVRDGMERPLDQDQRPDLVALEAPEAGDAEQPRGVED